MATVRVFPQTQRNAGTYESPSASNSLKRQQRINGVLQGDTNLALTLVGVMSAGDVADATNGMDIEAQHSPDNTTWTTFAFANGWRGGSLLPDGTPAFPSLTIKSESMPEGGFVRARITTLKRWSWGLDLEIS
jgi:hypothetical protein